MQINMAIPRPMLPADGDAVMVKPEKLKSAPPELFRVILLNDDFTPMDFVVFILQKFFGKSMEVATTIMLQIHHQGRGVCGIYSQDIAATKVDLVMAAAQKAQHPLQCLMEAA